VPEIEQAIVPALQDYFNSVLDAIPEEELFPPQKE